MARVPCPRPACGQYGTYYEYGPCPTCGKKWIEVAEGPDPLTGQPAKKPCPGGHAGAAVYAASSPLKCAFCGYVAPSGKTGELSMASSK